MKITSELNVGTLMTFMNKLFIAFILRENGHKTAVVVHLHPGQSKRLSALLDNKVILNYCIINLIQKFKTLDESELQNLKSNLKG